MSETNPQTLSHDTRHKPADVEWRDPVIEAYKKDVDRTLLRENLKLTVDERFGKFERFVAFARELWDAGRAARAKRGSNGTELS